MRGWAHARRAQPDTYAPPLRYRGRVGSPAALTTGLETSTLALSDTELASTRSHGRMRWAWPEPGCLIGRYRLERLLGAGAMGVVYAARDTTLRREVALKLVHPHRCTSAEARLRFVREAELLARVEHPNVVAIYDVGSDADRQYFVMEKVEAQGLRQWLSVRPRRLDEIVACFRDIARGLAAAHEAGVVHRDFKPTNVLVDERGVPKVTDFGLAQLTPDDSSSAHASTGSEPRRDATTTGHGSGTPAYMAPEQHRREPSGPAADQYAFFVALYEAVVGRRPFRGAETDVERLGLAKQRGPDALTLAHLPRRLRAAVRRGLAPDPHARHSDLHAAARALTPRRRPGLIVLGVAAGLLALAAGTAPAAQRSCEATAHRELREAWSPVQWSERARGPFAAPARAVDHARRSLDAWSERWQAARAEACHHARADPLDERVASGRRACLSEQLELAAASVDGLRRANEVEALVAAASALSDLPEPERCRFVGDRQGDGPRVPEALRRELEAELAEATVAASVGDHARALELATRVERRASEAGATHLRLSAAMAIADVEGDTDRAEPAAQRLMTVIDEARERSMPRLAAEAANDLAWIQGVRLRDRAASQHSIRLARSLAAQTDDPLPLEAAALATHSVVLEVDGQLEPALELAVEATDLLEHAPSDAAPLARLRTNLAAKRVLLAVRLGRYERAAAAMDDALARSRQINGDLALYTIGLLAATAEIDRMLGRYDHALRVHDELESIYTLRDGPRSSWVSQNLMNESRLHVDRGELGLALERLERACAIADEAKGPDSTQATLCRVMQLDARARARLVGPTEAECEQLDALRATAVTRLPDHSPFAAEAQLARARCWGARGRRERALEWIDEIEVADPVGTTDLELARARAHHAAGDTTAALEHYHRAREALAPGRRPGLRALIEAREAELGSPPR